MTVDHFALSGGTITLEDRALAEPRTWASEQITIEARNVSTRRNDGTAVGRSLVVGAPVSLEVKNLRLYPIHLQATVNVEGADLTPLQVYVPPGAPILIAQGRASTTLALTLDAREGLRADATGRLEDLVLLRPEGGDPLAVVPRLTAEIAGFGFRDGHLQLARLAVDGATGASATPRCSGAAFRRRRYGRACPISRGRRQRPAGSTFSPVFPEAARWPSRARSSLLPPRAGCACV